ncbi:alpha-glucosidase [Martelella mediterranea]|uniref:Oligo-1,6-glucosidase n=1 Tax=Martelella mediterranea TaxID=293089 RepID=A0A4R3P5E3_9HYPH|nr:alpha-glucosidase [Martelella mediterranea]TCT44882.1 oligo-1,6-glucosidase [Martelella mediterranea]
MSETVDTAGQTKRWWKEAVAYQIYPRSFADSNGDGIGDIPGIIEKLDYIADMGIDVIWLSPHFDSPNADNGYDIRDYRKVMNEFGTMADFDRLLSEIKQRNMRLIIDLVVNHSSDEHEWFVESRASRDNPKRDYYIWRNGAKGVPNNFTSFFGGSAWEKDEATGDYYLHYFAKKQPDLNWDNDEVRAEVYDLMRFWLDKGVSGFRMDVIPFISKNFDFPDLSEDELKDPAVVYASGPRLHEYLQDMNRKVLSHYDCMTVGEAAGVSEAQTPLFVDEARKELDMIFNFAVVMLDRDGWRWKERRLTDMKATFARLDQAVGETGWNTVFLGNHDQPRAVNHFGDARLAFRELSAKALATMMLTMRGTPFIYQGEELGMTNFPFTSLDQFDDIEVRGLREDFVATGKVSEEDLLWHLNKTSRDHARTPMQWDESENGGFTTAENAWLAVNPNYKDINAKAACADENSIYHHYRKLIALRHATPALVYGSYRDIAPEDEQIFAFERVLGDERLITIINFSGEPVMWDEKTVEGAEVLISNDQRRDKTIPGVELTLLPWEAVVLRPAQ